MAWRWGVVGPGEIATRFADAMTSAAGGEIAAVASRSIDRATAYADRYGVASRYGSYEELAADPDIDVVYVATLPVDHEAHARLFLEAGKHVLCEKPFALDATQAARMVEEARQCGLFLMEGMWSRFLPAWRTLSDVVSEGRIGEVRLVEASLGFPFPADSRVFDLGTGGGALLDLGVYPINLSAVVFGPSSSVVASGSVGEQGVDEHSVVLLGHEGGGIGVATSAITEGLTCTARITGTGGSIDLPAFFHMPDHLTVTSARGVERIECGFRGDGLRFEVEEVHRCLEAGLHESPAMPLDETLRIMGILDEARSQIGVTHPAG